MVVDIDYHVRVTEQPDVVAKTEVLSRESALAIAVRGRA